MTYADRVAAPFFLRVSDPETPALEADLVRHARERDIPAFEILYRTHVERVYALCLRMTAHPTRAEECTQQTFLAAWEKLRLFRGESAFSTWLHRIAVNTVLAALRAEERRTQRVFGTDDLAAYEEIATPRPPAAGLRLDLEQAIATLPPQARAVFVLHDVEGWKHHEIAAQLGVAPGTSKAQLHRARKLLQEALS